MNIYVICVDVGVVGVVVTVGVIFGGAGIQGIGARHHKTRNCVAFAESLLSRPFIRPTNRN